MSNVVFQQVLIMALLMCLGYLLQKTNLISEIGAKEIGKLLVYIVIPSVIIKSFITEYTIEKVNLLTVSFLLSFICFTIAIGISFLFFKQSEISNFGSSFCNAGFIGIPLVQATLGDGAVFLVVSVVVQLNVLQWTYGVFLLTRDKTNLEIKKIVFNPVILATILGLTIFLGDFEIPGIAKNILSNLSALNTPLAMIVCGTYLSQSKIIDIFTSKKILKVSVIRLIVIPLVTLIFLMIIPGYRELKFALFLALITPVGTNLAIFAHIFNKDFVQSVKIISNSTILSIVTIPVWISIFEIML